MFNGYFSEREGIREPAEKTYNINQDACKYLYNICSQYFNNMERFGEKCSDNGCKCGIDYTELMKTLKIEIPDFTINKDGDLIIEDNHMYSILDFIELVFKNIKDIKNEDWHKFFSHTHYTYTNTFNVRDKFIKDINDGFIRSSLLYQMNNNGIIERIDNNNVVIEDIISKLGSIKNKNFKDLIELIEKAIKCYKSKNQEDWKTATEKIWDAFENMKTYYFADKKKSVKIILENISPKEENFKTLIENEYRELTDIGNTYKIRHFEKDKIEIKNIEHYNYFFNRCLSVINLTLPYLKEVEKVHG